MFGRERAIPQPKQSRKRGTMAFWRRKNEGFEWQRYVRTTKLIRRKERREKLEEAGAAAVFGAKRAAWYSAERLQTAGRNSLSAIGRATLWSAQKTKTAAIMSYKTGIAILHLAWLWICRAAKRTGNVSSHLARRGAHIGGHAAKAAAGKARDVAQQNLIPAAKRVGAGAVERLKADRRRMPEWNTAQLPALVAALSGLLFAGQWLIGGLTTVTIIAGVIFIIAAAVLWVRRSGWDLSRLPRQLSLRASPASLPSAAAWTIAGLALLTGSIFAAPYAIEGIKQLPTLANFQLPNLSITTGALFERETITGRATAVSGDRLKIKRKVIELDGIEAPLLRQSCLNDRSREWSCGWRAKRELARLLRRRKVTCEILSQSDDGNAQGHCRMGETDIADAIVRQGYAFADSGFFSRYTEAESEAQAAKRGIWRGQSLRPQAYRDKLWQTAADKAPDGCPIKAMKRRGRQLYALPWDRSYSRISTRKRRGGRWFCSEEEALTAGYQRAS
jgi:endonuclease YncB( thermonuclease family)